MQRRSITISLIQMNVVSGRPEKNLARFHRLLDSSSAAPDIILLPELWSSGYDYKNFTRLAETTPFILEQLALTAQQHNSYIGGSLVEADNHHFYNTFFLLDPGGRQIAAYRKIHLFSLMEEDKHFTAGRKLCLIDIYGLPVGLLTCYDLRFPELSRGLTLKGAELLLICAQWPKPRVDHWQTLLKARAIENQCYVAACNRIGRGIENHFPGRSAIYDPWGQPALTAAPRQGAFSATIVLNKIKQTRSTIACYNDRRPEIY